MASRAATRILVIEDEQSIAVPLADGLRRESFDVRVAHTGAAGVAAAADADLVLLDLGLPDVDGVDVCRLLSEKFDVPIIVLTARGDEAERVRLLEIGADDYVVKPFGFRELVARIGAVLRRAGNANAGPGSNEDRIQELGLLRIDHRSRRVMVEEREVVLSRKEFDLLARLAEDPGAVVRRERILEEVWDEHWWGSTKTLDVHVASLRKKLGDASLIATIRGVGYRLDCVP
ncbi:MAG TPA: response regulator transcription factor [Acidimicrobiia bacterium]|nr:response regulator transcription factor [Acidimicrobiia bacterium]